MKFLRLVLVLVIGVVVHKALAQSDSDDFLDDDEPFDEPVDTNQRAPGPRSRGPSIPKPPPSTNDHSSFQPNSDNGPSSGEVVFKLVDPPQYWKPKKRHHRNQAKDQKDMKEKEIKEARPMSAKAPAQTDDAKSIEKKQ